MHPLGEWDQLAILSAAHELGECQTAAGFEDHALTILRDLIPVDVSAVTRLNVSSGQAQVDLVPDSTKYRYPAERVAATMPDNPIIAHWAAVESPTPSRVCDHVPQHEWESTETFNLVLRPMGTPHLLGLPVAHQAQGGLSFALARSGRDFSDRDVAVASMLQPALVAVSARFGDRVRPGTPSRRLTERQRTVLGLIADGWTAAAAARHLGVTEPAIRKHLERIYRTLEVNDRLLAVTRARETGEIP